MDGAIHAPYLYCTVSGLNTCLWYLRQEAEVNTHPRLRSCREARDPSIPVRWPCSSFLNQPSCFPLILPCNLREFFVISTWLQIYSSGFCFIRHLVFEVEKMSLIGKKKKIIPYHCAYSIGITSTVLDIDTFRLYLQDWYSYSYHIYKKYDYCDTWDPTRLKFHKKSNIGTRLVLQNFDIGPTLVQTFNDVSKAHDNNSLLVDTCFWYQTTWVVDMRKMVHAMLLGML